MEIVFDRSFNKSLNKINEAGIKNKILEAILQSEMATSLGDIPNIT
jgi:hypothetical protein